LASGNIVLCRKCQFAKDSFGFYFVVAIIYDSKQGQEVDQR